MIDEIVSIDECINLKFARDSVKNNPDVENNGYIEKGCYNCDGLNLDCDSYFPISKVGNHDE